MEAAKDKFGKPMERESDGHDGGGSVIGPRRAAHLAAGIMTKEGHDNGFLAFRPSSVFMRVLGADILAFNDGLVEFRGVGVDHLMAWDDEGVNRYYGELKRRMEVVRDRLEALMECCNEGYDGQMDEALKVAQTWVSQKAGDGEDSSADMNGSGPPPGDVYAAIRQRNVDAKVLTELGSEEGYVAFRPCPYYGRVVGEIVYLFNDALRRVEGRTAQYIHRGQVDEIRRYYAGLMAGMKLLRGEMEDVVAFCRRGVEAE